MLALYGYANCDYEVMLRSIGGDGEPSTFGGEGWLQHGAL